MSKDKNKDELKEEMEKEAEVNNNSQNEDGAAAESELVPKEEYDKLEAKLKELTTKCDEYFDKCQRSAAEFDNYKKRTVKEKEALYSEAFSDAVQAFLPVVDNMERAVQALSDEGNGASNIKEGVDMVFKQLKDVFSKLGVEEIEAQGKKFDPELHNAVMHIEDDSLEENQVVEVFQKGYKLKDRVLRHSMVKVAN